MVTVGILAGFGIDYLLGHQEACAGCLVFRRVLLSFYSSLYFFLPETPHWLVVQGRDEEAKATLRQIGTKEHELDETIQAIRTDAAKKKGTYAACFARGMRMPLFVGVMLAVFQQYIGINTVIYYAPTFLVGIGEKADAPC